MTFSLSRKDAMTCCASEVFAAGLSSGSPFTDFDAAVSLARHIWWTQVHSSFCMLMPIAVRPHNRHCIALLHVKHH